MSKLDRNELLKIAELSALKLDEEEVAAFVPELQKVIDYTDQLAQVALGDERKPARNINLFRQDVAVHSDNKMDTVTETLINQSPEHHETYFVVPKVIDND